MASRKAKIINNLKERNLSFRGMYDGPRYYNLLGKSPNEDIRTAIVGESIMFGMCREYRYLQFPWSQNRALNGSARSNQATVPKCGSSNHLVGH